MVELTHGGTWLKWSTLNRRDRNWAILSFATSTLASVPVTIPVSDWSYRLGYRLGAGTSTTSQGLAPIMASDLFAFAMLGSAILAVISALAWWQFSRNQDEMFNKIQNYAIAQACGWTFALAFVWWLLRLGNWVGDLPLAALVGVGTALLIGFWLHGVRRWL